MPRLSPLVACSAFVALASYADGRPETTTRMEATGAVAVIRHGSGPGHSDELGAREAICFQDRGAYYLHFD